MKKNCYKEKILYKVPFEKIIDIRGDEEEGKGGINARKADEKHRQPFNFE